MPSPPDVPRNGTLEPAGAELRGAKRRIVERLQRTDSATAPELAAEFGLTDTGVRQHLETLEAAGWVARRLERANGRGRPPVRWRLTPAAATLFADRHGELSVDLITGIRDALGADALHRVLDARVDRQSAHYRAEVGSSRELRTKVRRLAALRSGEGYVAEAVSESGAAHVLLVEHHCPIRSAAEHCAQLCDAELELFRRTLGPDVAVDREQHLLAGDQRCAYRIHPA